MLSTANFTILLNFQVVFPYIWKNYYNKEKWPIYLNKIYHTYIPVVPNLFIIEYLQTFL